MTGRLIEPRVISWDVARCGRCLVEPAAALLEMELIGWDCIAVQLDEWQADAYNRGRGDRSIEAELRAEERPTRLPQLRPAPISVEVCPYCRRTVETVAWLAGAGWPKDCRICRWTW